MGAAWQSMTPQKQLFIIVGGSLIGVVALIAVTLAAVGSSDASDVASTTPPAPTTPPALTTLPAMTGGKVFKYNKYIGSSYQDSPSACVNHFLTPSNKTRIDVIQYDHKNKKCIALTAAQLTTGQRIDSNHWSSLDLRPG